MTSPRIFDEGGRLRVAVGNDAVATCRDGVTRAEVRAALGDLLAGAAGANSRRRLREVVRERLDAADLLAPKSRARVPEAARLAAPLTIRMTRDAMSLIRQRAGAAGLPVAEFLRRAALRVPLELVREP